MSEGSGLSPAASTPGGGKDAFASLPIALQRQGRLDDIDGVPVLLVPPEHSDGPPPLLLWMHGRTAWKELDPGRYLRLMRRGIAVCAMDLPGHGARFDPDLQEPSRVPEVVEHAMLEIDGVLAEATERLGADPKRLAIGGMSAGGMATLARLCQPHSLAAAAVEATSGSWQDLPMARTIDRDQFARIERLEPVSHLDGWQPIPLLATHCRADQWIPFASQWRFLNDLERHCPRPPVHRVAYDSTGAQGEHAGFGRHAADAKEQHCRFLSRVPLDPESNQRVGSPQS